jgi:pimeloyl-ACP methyl ester carboxylesterase
MHDAPVIFPDKESGLGAQSLAREMQALASVAFNPPAFPENVPRGDGHAVLVIPGFLAGDWTTARLRDFLGHLDYRAETADILCNAGPTRGIMAKLATRLTALVAESAASVSLVGISLGGTLARYLARENPSSVRSVVTLCSPIRFPVVTPLQPFAQALTPLHEAEWVARRAEIADPLPMLVTAIYSEDDGIVDWRQCVQDEGGSARNVRVAGAHTTIGSNPDAQIAVARALAAAAFTER